jgi:hypothetical protein
MAKKDTLGYYIYPDNKLPEWKKEGLNYNYTFSKELSKNFCIQNSTWMSAVIPTIILLFEKYITLGTDKLQKKDVGRVSRLYGMGVSCEQKINTNILDYSMSQLKM